MGFGQRGAGSGEREEDLGSFPKACQANAQGGKWLCRAQGLGLGCTPPPNSQSEKVLNIGSAPRPRGTRKNSYSPCWKGTT